MALPLFVHLFGPFAFYSDMELPELPAAATGTSVVGIPIRVMLGRVPHTVKEPTFQGQLSSVSASEFLVNFPETAAYYVRNGSEIIIQPNPQADLLDVRGFLLGNIFAVLCHQRQLLPLHASAVRMGDGVVAFLGNSGAGKSTLAAFLAQAGYPLVADDICLLDPAGPAEGRVLPVAPWLKLWRGSLVALGQGIDGLAKTFTDEDKFRVPTGRAMAAAAETRSGDARPEGAGGEYDRLPLRAVVVLERRESGGVPGIVRLEPLRPVQAIGQMMKFTYQAYLLDWLGLQGEHFANCGKGLVGAAAYTCDRDWGFDSLPRILECLRKQFG